jgi:hypothetical protein
VNSKKEREDYPLEMNLSKEGYSQKPLIGSIILIAKMHFLQVLYHPPN